MVEIYILGIEAFLAIVRTHNLTKAAELMHLSQSTVSHRLKVLEQELGTSLIERHKGFKSISITPTGAHFIALAERWSKLWTETQLLQQNGPQLALSIGAVDSINTYLLPQVYQTLSQHYPPINMQIRTQQSLELYDQLERHEIDIAFVLQERLVNNIDIEVFFVEPLVVLRLANQTIVKNSVEPQELDPNFELFINWSPTYQIWHDRWWNPYCPSRIRLDTPSLLLALMRSPKHWAIIPTSMAHSVVNVAGQYVVQHISDAPPDRICYKITHKYPRPSAKLALNKFNEYIKLIFSSSNTA